jgi:hypothetical protein
MAFVLLLILHQLLKLFLDYGLRVTETRRNRFEDGVYQPCGGLSVALWARLVELEVL